MDVTFTWCPTCLLPRVDSERRVRGHTSGAERSWGERDIHTQEEEEEEEDGEEGAEEEDEHHTDHSWRREGIISRSQGRSVSPNRSRDEVGAAESRATKAANSCSCFGECFLPHLLPWPALPRVATASAIALVRAIAIDPTT